MKLTEQAMRERKNNIINAAFLLFCKNGIEGVTMSEIAKASNVGDATVYRYFMNKPLLVHSTLNILWKEISKELEKKVAEFNNYDQLTGLEQISVWLESLKQLYIESSDYVLFSYESKLYLQRNGIQLTELEYDTLMLKIKTPCIESINKGKADGSISPANESEDLFYAFWGCVRGYIVKIVIYESLCEGKSPWKSRYGIVKNGILRALQHGMAD